MAVNSGEIPCIIHFEGKSGPQKQLSNETLRTFIQRRKESLQLPDTCELEKYHQSRDIGKRSYDYLAYDTENVKELPEAVSYHLSCYQNFTGWGTLTSLLWMKELSYLTVKIARWFQYVRILCMQKKKV